MTRVLLSTLMIAYTFAYIATAEPVKLIFDTDMGNDVDDALALAMIHSLQSRGECELLAVTITKDHEECAPYIDAINTFYGRGDIPIGITHSGVTPQKSKFTGVTQEKIDGEYLYPHDLNIGDAVPDAVAILRKTLAAQPDNSVVIAQVGFSTNLRGLLDSRADEFSKLNGKELVEQKVKLISIMAGAFTPIAGKTHREYNVIKDIPAAQKLASEWPTPIIWSGFEIGLAIRYPAASIEQDFRYAKRHPIPESYQAYMATPHERPTWDLTSILWAVRPDRGYFGMSKPGIVTVLDNGETTFKEDPKGKQTFLKLEAESIPRTREILAALASEPPHN
jgi:inosine-uridine nucleoside N-ribohydrolase